MIKANEQNQIMHIDRYLEEKLKLDYWWMDAGCTSAAGLAAGRHLGGGPETVSAGVRPISDHAHARDVKILVWFEPERSCRAPGCTNSIQNGCCGPHPAEASAGRHALLVVP